RAAEVLGLALRAASLGRRAAIGEAARRGVPRTTVRSGTPPAHGGCAAWRVPLGRHRLRSHYRRDVRTSGRRNWHLLGSLFRARGKRAPICTARGEALPDEPSRGRRFARGVL